MDIDKNAYWVAHQPMRAVSQADRAKLQRRVNLQNPPVLERKVTPSSLDPELRSIFEKKSGLNSSAHFKPLAEATPDIPDSVEPRSVSPETEMPHLKVDSSEVPAEEHVVHKEEVEPDETKISSALLKRSLLFAERRKKEGKEVFRRRTATTCLPHVTSDDDDASNSWDNRSISPSLIIQESKSEIDTPVEIGGDDTNTSFPKFTDESFSFVPDRPSSENLYTRPKELLAQLRQLSNVFVHMISSEENKEEEQDEIIPSEHNKPIYSDPLQDSDKDKLKWYERPFKAHPFEYIPKPSPRFNCLCPGIDEF